MTCRSGKEPYATPAEAARVAASIAGRRGSRGRVLAGKLVHYKCPGCGAWHVGHKPLTVDAAKLAR